MRLIIVTGMSGAGKSTALKFFEDMGFYCVDNLPILLIEKFAELTLRDENNASDIALGIDIRSGRELPQLQTIINKWRENSYPFEILFLESSDREKSSLFITVLSFGFKYGIPSDADLVFDVRFLPNPYYVEELRFHTGMEEPVRDYVMQGGTAAEFLEKLMDLLRFLIPRYEQEGKNQLVIAVGCTGGKHRSVAIAHEVFKRLKEAERYEVRMEHRDADVDGVR